MTSSVVVRRCICLYIFHKNVRQRCIKFGTSAFRGLSCKVSPFWPVASPSQNLKTCSLQSIKINLHKFILLPHQSAIAVRELTSFLFSFLFLIFFLILLLKLSVLYSTSTNGVMTSFLGLCLKVKQRHKIRDYRAK